jgi:hypothetical protein
MLLLELHFEPAARHNSRIATPASPMIQINAVQVEAGTDLFDLSFVARQLFVKYIKKIHKCPAENKLKLCYQILSFIIAQTMHRKYKLQLSRAQNADCGTHLTLWAKG